MGFISLQSNYSTFVLKGQEEIVPKYFKSLCIVLCVFAIITPVTVNRQEEQNMDNNKCSNSYSQDCSNSSNQNSSNQNSNNQKNNRNQQNQNNSQKNNQKQNQKNDNF